MTLVPFLECCLLLGVDPKTLRLWLKAANLSSTTHPTDARLKCLTLSQLRHLADLHGRSLSQAPPAEPQPPPPLLPCPAVTAPRLMRLLLMRTCAINSPSSKPRWRRSRPR